MLPTLAMRQVARPLKAMATPLDWSFGWLTSAEILRFLSLVFSSAGLWMGYPLPASPRYGCDLFIEAKLRADGEVSLMGCTVSATGTRLFGRPLQFSRFEDSPLLIPHLRAVLNTDGPNPSKL